MSKVFYKVVGSIEEQLQFISLEIENIVERFEASTTKFTINL